MSDIYELFKEHIELPDDLTKVIWFEDNGTISWNIDGSVEDLVNEDGNTYQCEIRGQGVVIDNLIIFTLDSGCGYYYQAIFSLSNKRAYEELEEEVFGDED